MSDDVKLQVNETPEMTPSQEVLAPAKAEATVFDAKGRTIVLKKPGVLAQFNLVKVLGAEASRNQVYMNMVLPLIYVASIDGEPVSKGNQLQIDALINRLDEEGVIAVQEGVQANWGAPDPEADKAAIKN